MNYSTPANQVILNRAKELLRPVAEVLDAWIEPVIDAEGALTVPGAISGQPGLATGLLDVIVGIASADVDAVELSALAELAAKLCGFKEQE